MDGKMNAITSVHSPLGSRVACCRCMTQQSERKKFIFLVFLTTILQTNTEVNCFISVFSLFTGDGIPNLILW